MPRERAYGLCAILFIGDWIVACMGIFAGLELREWQRHTSALHAAGMVEYLTVPILWSMAGGTLFVWSMATLKTYEVRNIYRLQLWFRNMGKCVIAWSIAAWAYIGLFSVVGYAPRLGVAYSALLMVAFAVLWRMASFLFMGQPAVKAGTVSRVIVVGWNQKVAHLRKAMRRDAAQLSEIIGCVPLPGEIIERTPPPGVPILGHYSELQALVALHRASSIILSGADCAVQDIQDLVRFCQREYIGFQLVPEYFPPLRSSLQVQTLSGVPLLGLSTLPLERTGNRLIKRSFDVAGALVGMLFGVILLPILFPVMYLCSGLPIFLRERKVTHRGRVFNALTFNTQAPQVTDYQGAKKPLVRRKIAEKTAAFMRISGIAELPKLWNVLIGDMSLVGPFPDLPDEAERYRAEVPNYGARSEVRAGLTGWAQVSDRNGDMPIVKRVEADLYYLENWNVMVDLYCIAASVLRTATVRKYHSPSESNTSRSYTN